ncbi:plasminogen-binding N-terminal domain-containing protein [Helicobacter aurati]|nr:plasminogen-binding N-terminal domain-containing protein [Helicobacter aurati]
MLRYIAMLFLCSSLYVQSNTDKSNIENDSLKIAMSHESIAEIKNLTQIEITQIGDVENAESNNATFITFPAMSLKVGETGIVMRDLESYQGIAASVEVINVNGATATAKILPFTQLQQPYLPTPRITPQKNDKVIFRSYNNKAFLIAPDEKTYNAIKAQYPFIDFVSSDLLMGFLNSRGKHDPTSKTLPAACNEYAVGLVFIMGSNTLAVLNCQNLKTIHQHNITLPAHITPQSPFYTRIDFDGGGSLTYMFASKKSRKDYFGYYDSLIQAGNAQ